MGVQWMFAAATESVKAMLVRIGDAIPRLGAAVLILLAGWLIAKGVKAVLTKALRALPVDEYARRLKIAEFLQKGDIRYPLSELIGVSVYWMVLLAFLLAVLDVLGLTAAAGLLEKVLDYIPQVLAGVVVIILGLFFASVVAGVVQTAAANAGIGQARGLGQIARVVVILFAAAVALEKFLSSMIVQTTVQVVVAAVAFGAALAFGLGCKDLAGKAVSEFFQKISGGR